MFPISSFCRALLVVLVGALLGGCRGTTGIGPTDGLPLARSNFGQSALQPSGKATGKIDHIVIVIQENRSFNNLFYGYPGAKTSGYGHISNGEKVALQPVSLATKWDLQHNGHGFIESCNGTGKIPGTDCRMNGFDKQTWYCGHGGAEPPCPDKYPPYSYVPHDEIQPYFDMAHQYVLADEMYSSDFDTSSFISHQYIIAGVNPSASTNYPTTAWGCPGGKSDRTDALGTNRSLLIDKLIPCWNPKTLGDELDKAHVSWAFYASRIKSTGGALCGNGVTGDVTKGISGYWSAYQAIQHVCYGPDWHNVISSPARFLPDVAKGHLRAVSWITPTYANSDHGGSGSKMGPSWVASIVNAVGKSKYWNSTAIFIFWDDSGGWYDPEPPAYLDNDGLGFRLPLLIISPYAKKGLVSHVHYEHGSILKFVEDQFALPRLAASDARAKSPQRFCFDFKQPPRKFTPIKAPLDGAFFVHQPPDLRPPDTE